MHFCFGDGLYFCFAENFSFCTSFALYGCDASDLKLLFSLRVSEMVVCSLWSSILLACAKTYSLITEACVTLCYEFFKFLYCHFVFISTINELVLSILCLTFCTYILLPLYTICLSFLLHYHSHICSTHSIKMTKLFHCVKVWFIILNNSNTPLLYCLFSATPMFEITWIVVLTFLAGSIWLVLCVHDLYWMFRIYLVNL